MNIYKAHSKKMTRNLNTEQLQVGTVREKKKHVIKTNNFQVFGHSVMLTGVITSGPSFFPDLFVHGLKNG